MRTALVALRIHRWSLWALAGLCISTAALSGWIALVVAGEVARCQLALTATSCTELATSGTLRSQDVVKIVGLLGFLPFIGGALVGGPLVAREIEHRTASLAWPLAVSRWRWLVKIAAPVIGTGAIMIILPAAAGYVLVAAYAPGMDPARTFEHFGLYGPALVWRFLAVASVALLMGVVLGRTLPALIASATAAAFLFFLIGASTTMWLTPVALPHQDAPGEGLGDLFVRQLVRLPNGELVAVEVAEAVDPELSEVTETIEYGLPRDRAPEVALREAAALLGLSLIAIAAATAALRRRSPY